MSSQLPFVFDRDSGLTLGNFYAGPNAHVLQTLQDALEAAAGSSIFLQGGPGSGKTHVLLALCNHATARGNRVAYLPFRMAGVQFKPNALQGLEKLRNLFFDDVDAIAGKPLWERELAERLRAETSAPRSVLLSGRRPLDEIGFQHRWLKNYVRRSQQLELTVLTDDDRLWALQRHAQSRGIRLAEDVARYLTRQLPGDLGEWVRALHALDYASLANKRRFTKPFIRSVLKPPER